MFRLITILVFGGLPLLAHAELEIFACEPEWTALAVEIGGDNIKTTTATNAYQDPHYLQAKPSLIAKVRQADLVVCSGAELEIGWLPLLIQKANNPRVAPGSFGYFEASNYINRQGINTNTDRAQGDVHALGNPHVHTSPHNIGPIAVALTERMAQLDSVNADSYRNNLQDFLMRWDAAIVGWEARITPLRGKKMITHHKSWIYLQQWLDIEEVANLEPVPGLPPTSSHLSRLLSQFGEGGADFIVRSPYQDDRGSNWLADRSGIPAIVLPFTIDGNDRVTDLFSLYTETIDLLLGTLELTGN